MSFTTMLFCIVIKPKEFAPFFWEAFTTMLFCIVIKLQNIQLYYYKHSSNFRRARKNNSWRLGRDSNPWPLAWQASILINWTTEPYIIYLLYLPQINYLLLSQSLESTQKIQRRIELQEDIIMLFYSSANFFRW